MFGMILILLVVKIEATIQLGRIQNAIWLVNMSQINNEYINISNITCDQCLCRMITMNNLTTSIASIACQQEWKTCQLLFGNATAQLQTDENSLVYFQTIPKFRQTTMNQQSMTSSISSMVSTAVTMKMITSSAAITHTNNTSTSITTVSEISTMTTARAVVPIILINPGGELGSLYPWTPSSSSAPILDNGTADGANIRPHNGSYDFFGGYKGGSLYQRVLLTNTFSTAQLDSGLLHVSISFWERTSTLSTSDTGQVTLIFLSATNNSLSNVTTGPYNCVTRWCQVTDNWSLPKGTRTINYVMMFVAHSGTTAVAWIDDNSINVY